MTAEIAARFLSAILTIPRVKRLLSSEHFTVDGTLIEAWAELARGHAERSSVGWTAEGSMKSLKPRDGAPPDAPNPPCRNAEVDVHGKKRSNATHAGTTDPEARLYRKGKGREAKLCFMGHALMENRNGLIVDACVTQADGHAERTAALIMIETWADRPNRITLGADKGYDARDFVNELRSMGVTPHVAQNTAGRRSAIDGRVTRHPGHAISQVIRKRIEEAFGWGKEVGPLRRIRARGRVRVDMAFSLTASALPHPTAQAAGRMTPIKDRLRGRWRMTETSLWDRAYLDLVEPAFIAFAATGDGEFRFGVVVASLDCAYSLTDVDFEWEGSDEGTDVEGDGRAEPNGSDTIKGEIAFHNGDETTFKARRWP